MSINSTQGFKFKLIASGSYGSQQLDLFQDEEIKLSDNITGLFDLGALPSDFTKSITCGIIAYCVSNLIPIFSYFYSCFSN